MAPTEQHRRVPLRSLLLPDTDRDPRRRRRFLAIRRRLPSIGRSSSKRLRQDISIESTVKEAVARSERQGRLGQRPPAEEEE